MSEWVILSARPAVTFLAEECYRLSTSTQVYCLVSQARGCEQLSQGCYTAFFDGNWTHDLLIASSTPYRYAATPPIKQFSWTLRLHCEVRLLFVTRGYCDKTTDHDDAVFTAKKQNASTFTVVSLKAKLEEVKPGWVYSTSFEALYGNSVG